MDNIIFSIIVPVYKVEKFLRKCLDSIAEQSFENFEVILVDDGSPDKCGSICDEYALKDKRFKVIHQKNTGLSGARNAGKSEAVGKYLVFVDSDDYVNNSLLSTLYSKIEEDGFPDVVLYGYTSVFKEKNVLFIPENIPVDEIKVKLLIDDWKNYAWNKCYKRSIFTSDFPVGKIYEDLSTIPMVVCGTEKISIVSKSLYFYNRMNEGAITATKTLSNDYDCAMAYYDIYLFAVEKNIGSVTKVTLRHVIRRAIKILLKNLILEKLEEHKIDSLKELLKKYYTDKHITDLRNKILMYLILNGHTSICKLYAKFRHYDTRPIY